MKICPNCRQGYPDDGRFCATCGTALVAATPVATAPVATAPVATAPVRQRSKSASPMTTIVLEFLYKVFAILSATFTGCAFLEGHSRLYTYQVKEYLQQYLNRYFDVPDSDTYYYSREYFGNSHIYLDESLVTISAISAVLAVGLAITLFILTLVKQRRCQPALTCVVRFLAAGGLMAIAICMIDRI